jgi:hypothetical protein
MVPRKMYRSHTYLCAAQSLTLSSSSLGSSPLQTIYFLVGINFDNIQFIILRATAYVQPVLMNIQYNNSKEYCALLHTLTRNCPSPHTQTLYHCKVDS